MIDDDQSDSRDDAARRTQPVPDPDWRLATRAIRVGHVRTPEGEHCEPIFTTSSFVFDSAAEAAARFSGDLPGNVY
jgi:O-succinylhomoserine sulfhydrylase